MVRIYLAALILFMAGMTGCSKKEQVYQGMYKGFSQVNENRQSEDPSFDPAQAGEQTPQTYQEYKRDRKLLLKEDDDQVKESSI
jgi:hypothetical protein